MGKSNFTPHIFYIDAEGNQTVQPAQPANMYLGYLQTGTLYIRAQVDRNTMSSGIYHVLNYGHRDFEYANIMPIDGYKINLFMRYDELLRCATRIPSTFNFEFEVETSGTSTVTSKIYTLNITDRASRGLLNLFLRQRLIPVSELRGKGNSILGRFLNAGDMSCNRYLKIAKAYAALPALQEEICHSHKVLNGKLQKIEDHGGRSMLFTHFYGEIYGDHVQPILNATPASLAEVYDMFIEKGGNSVNKETTQFTISSFTNARHMLLYQLGRERTQNQLMHNLSANGLGKKLNTPLLPEEILAAGDQVDYEWLHLIAHRFGIGGDATNTESSQVNTNLVLGTSAANTQMILIEDAIASYLKTEERSAIIMVTTHYVNITERPKNLQCLADTISYFVTLQYKNPKTQDNTVTYSLQLVFNPMDTYLPTTDEYYIFQEIIQTDILQVLASVEHPEEQTIKDEFDPDEFFNSDFEFKVQHAFQASHLTSPLFALKLSGVTPCDVIGREFVPKSESVQTRGLKADTGDQAFTAQARLFGNEEIPTKMALLANGHSVASMELPSSITLDHIFDSFDCDNVGQFVFQQAKVNYVDHHLTLEGVLSVEEAPLRYFKELLPENFTLYVSADIQLHTFDLTQKIQPTHATFTTAASFVKPLGKYLTLHQAKLIVLCEPFIDLIKREKRWKMRPVVNARLGISGLASQEINLTTSISYTSGRLYLLAQCDEVKALFNLPLLTLKAFVLEGAVGNSNQLSVNTVLDINTRLIEFTGSMGSEGFGLCARLSNFDLNDLFYLYFELFQSTLDLPDYDIRFEEVVLSLATAPITVSGTMLAQGLHLTCQLTVHGTTYHADLQFSSEGIHIEGGCQELILSDIRIKEAGLHLAVYREEAQKRSDFSITGSTEIKGVTAQCTVGCEKTDRQWAFYLYARIKAETFSLSHLFPEVRKTLLSDISFNELSFVYADRDIQIGSQHITQGLTLQGQLNEIAALSALGLSTQNLNFLLQFGKVCRFMIETKGEILSLGESISCDPYQIRLQLTPSPSLALVFGFYITLPSQDIPLHFTVVLEVGTENAYGCATMDGWWESPFGVANLRIGPQVVLELDINYSRFIATRLPSSIGLAGGLQLGKEVMQMAVKIEQEARKDILVGSASRLTLADLLSLTETLTKLKLPSKAIPDFFDIQDFYLYIAPSGGSIGSVIYEKGVSFHAILVLFQKRAEVTATFNSHGFLAKGKMEALKLGPLEIRGKQKQDLSFDLELTDQAQHFLFDGLISLFGIETSVFVQLSKENIAVEFSLHILDLFIFECKGRSIGSLQDLTKLDIQIEADMQNNIAQYIQTNVVGKIEIAIEHVNTEIKGAEKQVEETEKAYHALYNPTIDRLDKAQKEADRYLDQCIERLDQARYNMNSDIEKAKAEVERTRLIYNEALDRAYRDVKSAEKSYRSDIDKAQQEVDRAEREYESALQNAINEVNRAEQVYVSSFESAKNDVRYAQQEVDKIRREANADIEQLKHLKWYEYLYKGTYLSVKIAGEEAAYGIAYGVLEAAKGILDGVRYSTQYIAFEGAKATLEGVRYGVKYTAFESSKATLQYVVKEGVTYVAFKNAELILEGIKEGSEYVIWQSAIQTLNLVRDTAHASISIAQEALDTIARSAAYIALEEAKVALKIVRDSSEFIAFQAAQAVLEGARLVSVGVLNIAAFTLEHIGDILDIRHIHLETSLKGIEQGRFFKATIELVFLGKPYLLTIDFDVNHFFKFIDDLFLQLIAVKQ